MFNSRLKEFSREEWESNVITPKTRKAFPVSVKQVDGVVYDAGKLLADDGEAARLEYPAGGTKPAVLLDMGPATPGGYPVFRVKSVRGTPVVRLTYSDWYDYINYPKQRDNERGDFDRGSCKYLGVELPVPPANPYRHELYTVTSPGVYAFPMIQGQQRWVRLQLETEGTAVEIDCFYFNNMADLGPHDGFFLCNDDDLNRLWYASTYTTQIASIENANAWEVVEGWLAPRGLAKCNEVGLSLAGRDWTDYSVEFEFKIMRNPGVVSAVGWVVRAQDPDNCYALQIDLDSRFHIKTRQGGAYRYLKNPVPLPVKMVDGVVHHIKTIVSGSLISTYLDGQLIDDTTDKVFRTGRIGFCQPLDKWAFVRNVQVVGLDGGGILADSLSGDLSKWDFQRTLSFLADGAKRDRLPWIGDLDWAGRTVYYAFRNHKYMKDSLRMFAFNQTPEGYVWGTCYPENRVRPPIGSYGYYQSDIFSAWFVPTVADYVLYSGDAVFAREMYEAVKPDVDYLWSYVEGDGLFCQRYDTSKGLWSHELEQVGKFAYHNVLIYDAMNEAAFIADFIGLKADAAEFRQRAEIIKNAIYRCFWSGAQGCLMGEPGSSKPCFMANALALAIRFFDEGRAASVSKYLHENNHEHGKIVSLAIRGQYENRFAGQAIERLRNPRHGVDWLNAIKDWRGPAATTECMRYPPGKGSPGRMWGDLSHPDTAMAHILSGYMLGVLPDEPGFAAFSMIPQTNGLKWAKGRVPTPHGDIMCGWSVSDDCALFEMFLDVPAGTDARAGVPVSSGDFAVMLNGRVVYDSHAGFIPGVNGQVEKGFVLLKSLPPGQHEIVRRVK